MNYKNKNGLLVPERSFDKYISSNGSLYEKPKTIGYNVIEILPILNGKKLSEYSMAIVHSARPSSIRIVKDEQTTDSYIWRVTIYIDKDEVIKRITQEVEIALPKDCKYSGSVLNKICQE